MQFWPVYFFGGWREKKPDVVSTLAWAKQHRGSLKRVKLVCGSLKRVSGVIVPYVLVQPR